MSQDDKENILVRQIGENYPTVHSAAQDLGDLSSLPLQLLGIHYSQERFPNTRKEILLWVAASLIPQPVPSNRGIVIKLLGAHTLTSLAL